MQRDISWLWGALWLFLLRGVLICPSSTTGQSAAQKHRTCRHGNLTHQKLHTPKKYCDPSFSNQTAGAITQKCSSGFYREWTGPHRGQCVPCRCNGLSDECDSHTGNCVNCQFNTDGDRCERCREGYYGNAAQRTCHPCPCPFTWNNFALTCVDVGSGMVECLCNLGYHGRTCDRCASGYYGNPMIYGGSCQLCNCSDGASNVCDYLTGECMTSGDTGSGDHCHECTSCTEALLNDLERMDDDLARLKQHLHSISQGAVSLLHRLEADISETKVLVGIYMNGLDPKVEHFGTEVDVIRDDLSQLLIKSQKTSSDSGKVSENVNGMKMNAEDLVSAAEALVMTLQNLIKQLSEVKPRAPITLPDNQVTRMVREAQRIVQEMRGRGCTQRKTAGNEQEEAHKLLDSGIRNMTVPLDTKQTAVSLMTSHSSLTELARTLSDADNTVGRTQGLNLKSDAILQDLLKLLTQLEKEQVTLLPMTEMTKDMLRNTTDISLMLEESKTEFERFAQLHGAEVDLIKKLNSMEKMDNMLIEAEEHAEELNRLAGELQLVVHNATNSSTDLLSAAVGKGAHNSIINIIEKAEVAANQSRVAADLAYKDVEQQGGLEKMDRLKDNANHLLTEAKQCRSYRKMLSGKVDSCKRHVNKQKKKGKLIRMELLAVSDLKRIKRDDIEVLLDSAKTAASASNDTISKVTDRLRNINQHVGRIKLTNANANIDDVLSDADQTLRTLNKTIPTLKDNLAQIQDLSNAVPPSGNVTESIRRIKEVIQETRNFVNRLCIATTFNGRGYVELRPPSNLEDVKAFTAVDLILNRHRHDPSQADHGRKRRQHKHKDADLFVFYLGSKDPSGDYVGMAVRSNILVCVYKLGGVVHEVETSQITTTSNVNSTDFDRVVFHRVYQDAEVNITQNFTSQEPIRLPPKRNLPNTVISVLNLDPESVVFYVGGYPEDFTPPVALRYPRYRGAMKLSLINDNPVSLFNYKHAVDIGEKQPCVKVPQSEVTTDYYEGTGYRMGLISNPEMKKRRLFKFININSRETNALLFYIGHEDSYFCVFVERGRLVLRGRQAGLELTAQSGEKVSLFNMQFVIEMDNKFTVHYGPKQISTDYSKSIYKRYYIGGLPAQLRDRDNITAPPLRGCVDQLRADGNYVEYNRTIGVSVGCPISLLGVREATFNSVLSVDSLGLWDKPPVIVSLGFRSTENHGALLRTSYQDSTSVHYVNLSLVDGCVVFHSDNYTLKSHKTYSDGRWHYVSAAKNPSGLELSIDNVNVGQGQPHHPEPLERTVGGENFKGCIANLYTRRSDSDLSFVPADLSSMSQKGDVVLGTCSLNRPPQTTPLPLYHRAQRNKNVQPQTGRCRGLTTYYGEYELSQPDSWLSYNIPPDDLNHRPHFSFEVRTRSSKGLLFHAAGRGDVPLLALFVANGKIKLSLGQNKIIQHKKRSNDGNWHRVVFSVERNSFHLLVDGFRVTDGHLSDDEGSSLDLQSPVYLGGGPLQNISKRHFIPKTSVIGCIRDLKLNEVDVGDPVANHGASPCLDGPSETGTYFGGAGGHIVLEKVTVGSHFDLAFELRPRRLTGLLVHVRSNNTSLDVFLVENKVGVKVSDGGGALSVSVTPHQTLCDGKFHMVAVSKQHKGIKLVVDSVSEQKVGRSLSTSFSTTLGSLHIGGISGTTKRSRVPVSSSYVGCLRNMRINGRPVALEAASSVVGPVNTNRCPAD